MTIDLEFCKYIDIFKNVIFMDRPPYTTLKKYFKIKEKN